MSVNLNLDPLCNEDGSLRRNYCFPSGTKAVSEKAMGMLWITCVISPMKGWDIIDGWCSNQEAIKAWEVELASAASGGVAAALIGFAVGFSGGNGDGRVQGLICAVTSRIRIRHLLNPIRHLILADPWQTENSQIRAVTNYPQLISLL